MASFGASLVAACIVAASFAACASPSPPGARDAGGAGPSASSAPRFARLGLLLAHDGNWRGRQIIPAAWVKDATSRHPDQRHLWPGIATPFLGYGYQTWIWPGEPRRFAFLGVRGQSILVDPQSRLVMVQTSVRKRPSNDPVAALTRALWQAVVDTLGN